MLRTHKSGIKKYRNGAVDRVVAPAMRDGRPERGRDRALDADGIAEVGGYINDGAAPLPLFRHAAVTMQAHRPFAAIEGSMLAVMHCHLHHQWRWALSATTLTQRAMHLCAANQGILTWQTISQMCESW